MSKIEWTDETWNPLAGCTVHSEGCKNCYAMRMAYRLEAMGQAAYQGTTIKSKSGQILWTGKVNFSEEALLKPLRWKKPRRIFVNSMADLFHESVPYEWIDRIFAVMALCPQHTFQVLTKRADRMREYFCAGRMDEINAEAGTLADWNEMEETAWPLPNVWLGVSVENQAAADERIPDLLNTPAAVRWISAEPLLGPVDLSEWMICPKARDGLSMDPSTGAYECCSDCDWTGLTFDIDWVVVGGESGTNARPMHPDWARSLRDQCAAAGVPFMFKQWGAWSPGYAEHGNDLFYDHICAAPQHEWDEGHCSFRVGKRIAGRLLDGREHNEFPVQAA